MIDVFGRIGLFHWEVRQTTFSVRPKGSWREHGTLQDILRIRQFLTGGSHYRSEILKALGKNAPKTMGGREPHAVIFDGATGFIRWRNLFQESNWIVILERTELNFKEAANLLNLSYRKDRIAGDLVQSMPPIPVGLEFVAYEEKLQ